MLAFERVPRFVVIELARHRIPVRDREILAVMLGVATDAFLLRFGNRAERGVQPAFGGDAAGDFGVALEAFEIRATRAHAVATGALRWPAETAVRLGERSGRNLRDTKNRGEDYGAQQDGGTQDCAHAWPAKLTARADGRRHRG